MWGRRAAIKAPITAVFLLLVGCTYHQETDNPILRKLTWFGYLDGDDIREACASGASDWYRLVYNGVYIEQVRSYEIRQEGDGDAYAMVSSVSLPADLSHVELEARRPDLLKPWRPVVVRIPFGHSQLDLLRAALEKDGVFGPPPVGLRMSSIQFYWVLSACHDGKYRFNAFLWPSDRFKSLTFPGLLASWDKTGIPVNPPRVTSEFSIYGTNDSQEHINLFEVKVDSDGLNRTRIRLR